MLKDFSLNFSRDIINYIILFKIMRRFVEIVLVLKELYWIGFDLFLEMVDSFVNWEKFIDIFVIGFEEIVDLNVSNIMKVR